MQRCKRNNCICSVTDLYPSSLCQLENGKNCHCGTKSILLGVVTKDIYENLFTSREAHEESINKVISLYDIRVNGSNALYQVDSCSE